MEFNSEEIEEFKNEATELLDDAEKNLLSLEKGGDFAKTYAAVFRVFHSLKGGAGMLGMQELQSHMHHLENHYQECKHLKSIPAHIASYFLNGIDTSRQIMAGEKVSFDYSQFKLEQNLSPPAEPTAAQPALSQNSNAPEPLGFTAEGVRVLVIDDEPEIIEILKDLLTLSGFEVAGFTSPKEALTQLKRFKPDVVLTDFRMPDLTGLEVLKAVNQIDPDLPVIYVSGHLSKEVIMESLVYGIFGALEKPFKQADVITMCKNASDRYRMAKLLNHTISFIYYQYSDLDQYLQTKGANEIRESMHKQFKSLIEAKRKLKFLRRSTLTLEK